MLSFPAFDKKFDLTVHPYGRAEIDFASCVPPKPNQSSATMTPRPARGDPCMGWNGVMVLQAGLGVERGAGQEGGSGGEGGGT